ncbi:hypothetical protein HF521_002986 [Silurus meridionalis]|uniref:Uncharacterized protein n=1 Tax=Silurus meridionalis TaxID=175797 RepID=A0A8T0B2P9_SILME|nr:hypothetical protein HF521_002986 [Silurus meridionalis]
MVGCDANTLLARTPQLPGQMSVARFKKALLFGKSVFLCGLILSITWSVQSMSSCPLADPQQFFTGKLYVLVYQLKLPAEELLWLALSWHPSLE